MDHRTVATVPSGHSPLGRMPHRYPTIATPLVWPHAPGATRVSGRRPTAAAPTRSRRVLYVRLSYVLDSSGAAPTDRTAPSTPATPTSMRMPRAPAPTCPPSRPSASAPAPAQWHITHGAGVPRG